MADPEDISLLLEGYMQGSLSPEGRAELAGVLQDPEQRQQCLDALEKLMLSDPTVLLADRAAWDSRIDAILSMDSQDARAGHVHRMPRRIRMAAAAVMLFALAGVGLLFYRYRHPGSATQIAAGSAKDLSPGGNKAVLQLSGGSRIILDSAADGVLARQGGAVIHKTASGSLAYTSSRTGEAEAGMNTLTTPRGGQWKLILPDGTRVWLNAASSLTYPTAFRGSQRKVSVTGEAYFEVAPDPAHPFIVSEGASTIQVLGTSFNINAYAEEGESKITLADGGIRVSEPGYAVLLKAGQQARMSKPLQVSDNADLESVLAWKNGSFSFQGADLESILRELARWYDFSVTYHQPIHEKFHLEMSRNTNLSNALRILEATGGVHFTIEGRQITVLP